MLKKLEYFRQITCTQISHAIFLPTEIPPSNVPNHTVGIWFQNESPYSPFFRDCPDTAPGPAPGGGPVARSPAAAAARWAGPALEPTGALGCGMGLECELSRR